MSDNYVDYDVVEYFDGLETTHDIIYRPRKSKMSSDNNQLTAADDLLGEPYDVDAASAAMTKSQASAHDFLLSTEKLEAELKSVSGQLETGKQRFHQIRDELKRRRETRDEQPAPKELTVEQLRDDEMGNLMSQIQVLTNKVIAMEQEQAKFIVELEISRAAQRDAEDRLALVAKHRPIRPRDPMTREVAADLAARCMTVRGVKPANGTLPDWAIDAVVEASR